MRRGGIGDAKEILEITHYCERAWQCPVCGYRAACTRFRELGETLASWTAKGGSVALLTLTQTHCIEDECDTLWDRLQCGWDALVRGDGWRADKEKFGLRGYVRITEVVHHRETGWNIHYHVPLLLTEARGTQHLCELKDRLAPRYINGITGAGGHALYSRQDLHSIHPGTERTVARYYTKGTTGEWTENSRTPMAILANLQTTGEGIDLWKEFSAAVTIKRRKGYSPSHHIADLVRTGHDGSC
jgi:hypothetical protein